MGKPKKYPKICPRCKQDFLGLKIQDFCSRSCGAAGWKNLNSAERSPEAAERAAYHKACRESAKRFQRTCKECSAEFWGEKHQKFCSQPCALRFQHYTSKQKKRYYWPVIRQV